MIRSTEEHEAAMRRIDELFHSPVGTPEGDELVRLTSLVEAYEKERYPIPPPDPSDALAFRMEQMLLGVSSADYHCLPRNDFHGVH